MSVAEKLNKKNRDYCFEVLGYDIMVDENFKVWLIEINKNTGLVYSSPIIKMLLPRMVDDSFKLTIDEIFGRSYKKHEVEDLNKSKFPVTGYSDEENLW